MDALKNAVGMGGNNQQTPRNMQGSANPEGSSNQPVEQKQGGGFLGGLGDKFNSAAGGGRESEKNEDFLDKGALATLAMLYTRLLFRNLHVPSIRAPLHLFRHWSFTCIEHMIIRDTAAT